MLIWKGHPRATYALCAVEMLERLAYYGTSGLLVLIMVGSVQGGGLGWQDASALTYYGTFLGAVWCSPLLGGLIADRFGGVRRAIPVGGGLLILGYGAVCLSLVLPGYLHIAHTGSLRDYCSLLELPLAQYIDVHTVQAAIVHVRPLGTGLAADAGAHLHGLTRDLNLVASCFITGLILIVAGNGFFKPSVTIQIGASYLPQDPARESAYMLFYMSVYAAVFLSGLVIGTSGERVGWAAGIAMALAAMLTAFITYLRLRPDIFQDEIASARAATPTGRGLRRGPAVVFIGTHSLVAVVFWTAYQQSGGLLSLFISEQVDRRAGDWTVPVTWFLSATALMAVMLGPVLDGAARRWERKHGMLQIPDRFALGLGIGAVAFAFLSIASYRAVHGSISMLWPLAFYCILTTGELTFSPSGFAMVGLYAPRRHQSAFMGVWLLSVALGSFLSGQIGALSDELGRTGTFAILCGSLAVSALLMLTLRRGLLSLLQYTELDDESALQGIPRACGEKT